MKLFILMVLGFALNACTGRQAAQNQQFDYNRELTTDQREEILFMADSYDYSDMSNIEPGIPGGVTYGTPEGIFPWDELPGLPSVSQLEEWASNVTFTGHHKVFVFKGNYSLPFHTEIEKVPNSIDYDCFEDTEYTIQSDPIVALGGLSIRVIPYLTDEKDQPFYFDNEKMPLHIWVKKNVNNEEQMNFNFGFRTLGDETPRDCKGYAEIKFIRSGTTYLRIPIGKEDIGKEYEMDGYHIKLIASQPGDVIIEYTGKQEPNWEITPIKDGKLMTAECEGVRVIDDLKHKVLFCYNHPGFSLPEYMVQIRDYSMKKKGIGAGMLRRDLKDYKDSVNVLPFTEADIEYLTTHEPPVPEKDADGNELHAIWFKTCMDAEAIYLYPQLFNMEDESLVIYKAQIKLEPQNFEDYAEDEELRGEDEYY